MPRLFALDHNFPQPIVDVLAEFQEDAELVRIDQVHPGMPDLDDWEVLLALLPDARDWDGLITTDSSILNQPLELSVLIQTKLTLVVALEAGHNPVKATGSCSPTCSRFASAPTPGDRRCGSPPPRTVPTSSRGTSSPGSHSTSTARSSSCSTSTGFRPRPSRRILSAADRAGASGSTGASARSRATWRPTRPR